MARFASLLATLGLLAACGKKEESSSSSSSGGGSTFKASTPKELVESLHGAFQRKDGKAILIALSKQSREAAIQRGKEEQEKAKQDPERAKRTKERCKTDKDVTTMDVEELAGLVFAKGGGQMLVLKEVKEEGDKADTIVEITMDGRTKSQTLHLVKEEGAWRWVEN